MATITPTTPTFTQVQAPVVLASGTTLGTVNTLDLKGKWGAYLHVRIGRRVTTALTRSAYVAVRKTDDNTQVLPSNTYDRLSSTAAAGASSTVSSGGASGTNQVTVASGTGFAAGDVICLHSDDTAASRVEWARVIDVTSATLTVDRNFRTSHNSGDRVTNGADVFAPLWLPGGDVYEITLVNNSGQSVLAAADAEVWDSVTST